MGFKSQADIDAAYQSGYTAGQAAGVTIHTGTRNIISNGTTDLGVNHSIRYIVTNVVGSTQYNEQTITIDNVNSHSDITIDTGLNKISRIWIDVGQYALSGYAGSVYYNYTIRSQALGYNYDFPDDKKCFRTYIGSYSNSNYQSGDMANFIYHSLGGGAIAYGLLIKSLTDGTYTIKFPTLGTNPTSSVTLTLKHYGNIIL